MNCIEQSVTSHVIAPTIEPNHFLSQLGQPGEFHLGFAIANLETMRRKMNEMLPILPPEAVADSHRPDGLRPPDGEQAANQRCTVRRPESKSPSLKSQMIADVGLGDWLLDIDETPAETLLEVALQIHRQHDAARQRVQKALLEVERLGMDMMAEVKRSWRQALPRRG